MAETRISDVVVDTDVLAKMSSGDLPKYNDFLRTGIATKDYKNADVSEGGHFANIPFYDQLTGASEVITDDTSLVPAKIGTKKDIGVVCHRGKAWASRDLAKILSGDDPVKEIAKQVARFWAKDLSVTLQCVLKAAFRTGGPLTTAGLLHDVAVITGTAKLLDSDVAIAAMQKRGDEMTDYDAVVMHSKVYSSLVAAELVDFSFQNDAASFDIKKFGKYLGMEIIVTDGVNVDTTTANYYKYDTYFCKKGALYLGMQKDLMTEKDRDILAQSDILATTCHFVPHLKLMPYNTSSGQNPANSVLELAASWSAHVAVDVKTIGIACVRTN